MKAWIVLIIVVFAAVSGIIFRVSILVEVAVVSPSKRADLLCGDKDGEFTEELIKRAHSTSSDIGSAILSECYISASHKIETHAGGFSDFRLPQQVFKSAFAGYANYHHADPNFEAERHRFSRLMQLLPRETQ